MYRQLLLLFFIPSIHYGQMSGIELVSKPVPQPVTREASVQEWNAGQPDYALLSEPSKAFLYWVNFCRFSPEKFWDSVAVPVLQAFPKLKGAESESLYKDLTNAGPLPMFRLSTTLIKTAQAHTLDLANHPGRPSHNSSDGTSFGARMKKAGIRSCASENMAITSQSPLLSVLLLYLDIGLPDKGHRKSLLDANLRETGIGSSLYGKDQLLFVQDLSCTQ